MKKQQKSDIIKDMVTIQSPICKIASSRLSFCSCVLLAISILSNCPLQASLHGLFFRIYMALNRYKICFMTCMGKDINYEK